MIISNPELEVTDIEGTTRAGNIVLSDGHVINWDCDDDGERFYFIVPKGNDEEEGLIIYTPIRGINPELVLAAISVEQAAQALEEGEYGKN